MEDGTKVLLCKHPLSCGSQDIKRPSNLYIFSRSLLSFCLRTPSRINEFKCSVHPPLKSQDSWLTTQFTYWRYKYVLHPHTLHSAADVIPWLMHFFWTFMIYHNISFTITWYCFRPNHRICLIMGFPHKNSAERLLWWSIQKADEQ